MVGTLSIAGPLIRGHSFLNESTVKQKGQNVVWSKERAPARRTWNCHDNFKLLCTTPRGVTNKPFSSPPYLFVLFLRIFSWAGQEEKKKKKKKRKKKTPLAVWSGMSIIASSPYRFLAPKTKCGKILKRTFCIQHTLVESCTSFRGYAQEVDSITAADVAHSSNRITKRHFSTISNRGTTTR